MKYLYETLARCGQIGLILPGLLLLALFPALPATAQSTAPESDPVPGKVSQFHDDWSLKVLDLANKIDGYFGNERIEEDSQQTRVKVTLDFDGEQGESIDTRARISARLSLPRLEDKWSIIVNGDNDDEEFVSDVENEDELDRSVALRFDAQTGNARKLSFDAGFKRPDGHYELFGRVRYQKTTPTENWLRRWDNRLYYYMDFGAEYDGKLEFDRALPPSLLFRSSTRLRWWESDKKCNGGICPEQRFTLYQRLRSPNHAISYESNTYFESKPFDDSKQYVSETNLRLRYRHSTPWDWAYVELRPTLAFPRDKDYEPTWRFLLRLEGIFGYKPSYDTLEFGPERVLGKRN